MDGAAKETCDSSGPVIGASAGLSSCRAAVKPMSASLHSIAEAVARAEVSIAEYDGARSRIECIEFLNRKCENIAARIIQSGVFAWSEMGEMG
ncbi:hypothetical protein D7S86_28065 [Pararobbsia silviterrae]|uniref:Uncharacterized protein n=1 Tax=Pararobbsia silviterrae TaxID=1792498 RepID=A0A494X7B5_9BURK|nr:hypothetical protein D7S86_28065 [Pararobbsia silviterrae]